MDTLDIEIAQEAITAAISRTNGHLLEENDTSRIYDYIARAKEYVGYLEGGNPGKVFDFSSSAETLAEGLALTLLMASIAIEIGDYPQALKILDQAEDIAWELTDDNF